MSKQERILNNRIVKILNKSEERRVRKPIIVEICGSPKSGKTTIIRQFEAFFKHYGFRVYTMVEKASLSRMSNKQSPDFNVWTALQTCIDLLELANSNQYDFIFLDRGIFDSLCWFAWHNDLNQLDDKSHKTISDFLLMNRWIRDISLVFAFTQEVDISIGRDKKHNLVQNSGSIMNSSVLERYNKSILETYKNNIKRFKHIELIDSSLSTLEDIQMLVGEKLLDKLEASLNEQIGFIKWDEKSFDAFYGRFYDDFLESTKIYFGDRKKVEKEVDFQPIACAVLLDETGEKVFVTKKSENSLDENSPERDKYLLWIGGHIRDDDIGNAYSSLDIIKNALHREVKEEVGIDIKINDEYSFIYTPTNPKSKQHIAVLFMIKVNEFIKFREDNLELLPKYGNSKYGKFHAIAELDQIFKKDDFEEWSLQIGYAIGAFKEEQMTVDQLVSDFNKNQKN